MRVLTLALLMAGLALPLQAQESPLVSLETSDAGQGWQAVGRLNLGNRGFCTGSLIAPDLVLTAAHCLYDKETGARVADQDIEFLAGWRNGRADAYRGVRRAMAHPDYVYSGDGDLGRVTYDVALIQLDRAIRLPHLTPFATDVRPEAGDAVGVVSYAQDRSEAPSLQQTCHVLDRDPDILILSCDVDFGSSGAPIFALRDGEMRIVSVVSAKAEIAGEKVALGSNLAASLETLRAEMELADGATILGGSTVRVLSGSATGGAKFVKP